MIKKKSADKYFSKSCICNRTRIVTYKKDWWKSLSPAGMKKLKVLWSRFLKQVSFFIFLGRQLSVNVFVLVVRQKEKKTKAKAQFIVFTPEDPQLLG